MRSLFVYFSFLIFCLACSASKVASLSTPAATVFDENIVLDSLAWTTDLKTAEKIAKAHDLKVLMIFTGSDWCRPCQQFKKEVLSEETFKEAAKDQVVVLYLDFPAKQRNKLSKKETIKNAVLAEQYNQAGAFPTILLLPTDKTASPCELNYEGDGPTQWIAKITEAVKICGA